MHKPSLRSQILLLDAEGRLETLPLKPPLVGQKFIVLARERCLFEKLVVASGIKARAALAAARIHAQTATPYQNSGMVITRQGQRFGMWFWDAEWVADKLAEAGLPQDIQIVPEPLVRAPGNGWRVAKASTGYEAQLWRGNFLVADQWRRRPYDEAAWRDFVRVQGEDGGGEATLSSQSPPYNLASPYRRTQMSEWTPERLGVAACLTAGIILAAGAGFFGGQAYAIQQHASDTRDQIEFVSAQSPAAQAKLRRDITALSAVKTLVEAPDPMALLRSAQEILAPMNIKVAAFTVNRTDVRLILPQAAIDQVTLIAGELDESPYFEDVKPRIDNAKSRLIVDMTVTGAKPATTRRVTRASANTAQ